MEEDWRLTRSDGFARGELLERQRARGERIVSLSPETPPRGGQRIVDAVQAAHEAALRASYVMPTIGHYSTHDSDILRMERTAEWERWYVGEGRGWVQVMSWEKRANKVLAQRMFDYDLDNELQVEFDWLSIYRESERPERAL